MGRAGKVSFTLGDRGGVTDGLWRRTHGMVSRRARIRLGAAVGISGAIAVAAAFVPAAPAGATTSSPGTLRPAASQRSVGTDALHLRAMPVGTVTFGRRHGRLTARAVMYGLTAGSSHAVKLQIPGRAWGVRFSRLTANSVGQADVTLHSHFTGHLRGGSRLRIYMGTGKSRIAREPIAMTRRLSHPAEGPHRLHSVEVSRRGVSYGTPRGRAAISYNSKRKTLTVTVNASGVTPGRHAAHIHLGSCMSQGPVKYMLKDLVANHRGRIVHATRVFTKVTAPIPASGWYLNIHQGNSGNILKNGQPTIFFRPLLCSNIRTNASIVSILRTGDIVTGVRGAAHGNVVLTGSASASGSQTVPFLYRGTLSKAATGPAVSVLTPRFPHVTSATFYGPDTHAFNPASIPGGQVRAVGSYQSSSAPTGVLNQGMIYRGPVNGSGGSWTSIVVPADGAHTTGHARACPTPRTHCFVMDTIAHSTMGNLVVGNYDLNPSVPGGVASGNGFIYNLATHRWTLLSLRGSMSSLSTLYGIWQDGGAGSPRYTLAGGSSDRGNQRAFLMNYNARTGAFGKPRYYTYGNRPALATHFDGITTVRGGFNLVAISSAQSSSMAFVPVTHHGRRFGPAKWHPVNVAASPLCSAGCSSVTGNTVYTNHVMGICVQASSKAINSYLATLSR
jgi:hypothetical protein